MFSCSSSQNPDGLSPSGRLAGFLLYLITTVACASSPAQLDVMLSEESLPGIVWATVDERQLLWGGSGYAELRNKTPMRSDTKVQVGSVTKTLVALGVLRLVSDGQLSLDSSVERLLPALNWNNPWREQSPITVRHLLEHTAGLDNLRMWQFLNSQVTGDTPLADAFPKNQAFLLRVRTRPGSQYSYSNMGYTLLGLVIEQLTSRRYEDYLARELLTPLGMNDSSFFFVTQIQDPRLAMGYLDGEVTQESVPLVLRPAGQFTSTAQDMQRLLRFLLGSGSLDGVQLVNSAYMDSLGRPSTTDASLAGLSVGHGLALAARDRHGVVSECHPGNTFGFRARLCVFRDEGKAFFYAINADNETSDYERFTEHFIKQLGVVPAAEMQARNNVDLQPYAGFYALAPSNMAQFAWLDWIFNSIWVRVDKERNGLVIRSLQRSDRLLLPLEKPLFRDAERRIASYVFLGEKYSVLSNGLSTWQRTSLLALCLGWTSLLLGVLGFLFILLRGLWLLRPGAFLIQSKILPPWLCLVAFALPTYLFAAQSFLQFGELTVASILLAGLSALLPLSLLLSLYQLLHQLLRSRESSFVELCAVLASLQLCLVLVMNGVFPVMFWR